MENNIQDKIGQILNDPEAMQQLKSLGAMMGLDTSNMSAPQNNNVANRQMPNLAQLGNMFANSNQTPPQQNFNPLSSQSSGFDMSSLLSNQEAITTIARVMPLLQNMNADDETSKLLDALYPFLNGERKTKLEKAKKLLKIFKILPLLKNSGIF